MGGARSGGGGGFGGGCGGFHQICVEGLALKGRVEPVRVDWCSENARLEEFAQAHGLRLCEVQVVYGVGHGYTNVLIGRELGIPEDTVKSHLRRVRWAYCALDRANVVMKLARLGLFSGGVV